MQPEASTITSRSRVRLGPLTARRESDGVVLIGHPGNGRFIEGDDDLLFAIHHLRAWPDLAQAASRWPPSRGEAPDMVALAQALHARGFVTDIDGAPTPAARGMGAPRAAPRFRFAADLRLWAACGLVIAWGAAMLVLGRVEGPRMVDLFPTRSSAWGIVLVFGGFLAAASLHEAAHYTVARAHGIRPRLSISHRLAFLVLQTDVTDAWVLRRAARLQIFLAGILLNLTVAGACYAVLGLAGPASGGAGLRFLAALNLLLLPFQLLIFARTDLYYVFALLVGERNLFRDAFAYARVRIVMARAGVRAWATWLAARAMGRNEHRKRPIPGVEALEWLSLPAKRRRLYVGFTVFTIVGSALTTFLVIVVAERLLRWTLPRSWDELVRASSGGALGDLVGPALALTVACLQIGVFVVLPLKQLGGAVARRAMRGARA